MQAIPGLILNYKTDNSAFTVGHLGDNLLHVKVGNILDY